MNKYSKYVGLDVHMGSSYCFVMKLALADMEYIGSSNKWDMSVWWWRRR